MPTDSVFAAELPWPDYDSRVRDGAVPILIPIGSMEQHGHHMPMHVDVLTHRIRPAGGGRSRWAGRATLHLRLQVPSKIRRGQSPARNDQPRRRHAGLGATRRHQGIRPPRRAQNMPRQRPLRELLVHHRGYRPCAPRAQVERHRRHQDRGAFLLGLRRQGDDHSRLYPGGFTGWDLPSTAACWRRR